MGFYNYKKTNLFYIFPIEGKRDIYVYFSTPLIAQKEKINENEVRKKEIQRFHKWLKDNNVKLKDDYDLNEMTGATNFLAFIKSEKSKIKFYNYINKKIGRAHV